jgi:hypothetical protein
MKTVFYLAAICLYTTGGYAESSIVYMDQSLPSSQLRIRLSSSAAQILSEFIQRTKAVTAESPTIDCRDRLENVGILTDDFQTRFSCDLYFGPQGFDRVVAEERPFAYSVTDDDLKLKQGSGAASVFMSKRRSGALFVRFDGEAARALSTLLGGKVADTVGCSIAPKNVGGYRQPHRVIAVRACEFFVTNRGELVNTAPPRPFDFQ